MKRKKRLQVTRGKAKLKKSDIISPAFIHQAIKCVEWLDSQKVDNSNRELLQVDYFKPIKDNLLYGIMSNNAYFFFDAIVTALRNGIDHEFFNKYGATNYLLDLSVFADNDRLSVHIDLKYSLALQEIYVMNKALQTNFNQSINLYCLKHKLNFRTYQNLFVKHKRLIKYFFNKRGRDRNETHPSHQRHYYKKYKDTINLLDDNVREFLEEYHIKTFDYRLKQANETQRIIKLKDQDNKTIGILIIDNT